MKLYLKEQERSGQGERKLTEESWPDTGKGIAAPRSETGRLRVMLEVRRERLWCRG